jgi:hypothetical protein
VNSMGLLKVARYLENPQVPRVKFWKTAAHNTTSSILVLVDERRGWAMDTGSA